MVFGNRDRWEEYPALGDLVKKCFRYLEGHDLAAYEAGSYPIDGDKVFVNVAAYRTAPASERFWEAHKAYLDIHVALEGTERIDVGFVCRMQQGEYVKQDDFLPLEGEKGASILLRPGDFLICCPNDAHRTGVAEGEPQDVKKAIFKVKVSVS